MVPLLGGMRASPEFIDSRSRQLLNYDLFGTRRPLLVTPVLTVVVR